MRSVGWRTVRKYYRDALRRTARSALGVKPLERGRPESLMSWAGPSRPRLAADPVYYQW